jgi:hypothetical protein
MESDKIIDIPKNMPEFNNINVSGFQNLTVYNSSIVIVNNGTTLVIGQ